MVTAAFMSQKALSFPGTSESPHFEKTSFRVKNKIFATYDASKNQACLKLSEVEQDVFSRADPSVYPVPNKWGKQGWTFIDLEKVEPDLFMDALTSAYCQVAPKDLSEPYRAGNNSDF